MTETELDRERNGERACRQVDFAVPVEHRVKIKESE